MGSCPSDNTLTTDQTSFWSSDGIDWDAHRVGWAISGGCAALTLIISAISVLSHARNYSNAAEQRQIIRILYMPPVYAIISFFSYRFFRSYTYYELIEVVYEAITISAFLLLIIEYVASTAVEHDARKALERKDKRALPIPFCCWRYRPTKAYFMYTVKWSVMQYVVVRPLVSVIAIICQKYNILCENGGFNFSFAYAYIEIVDCVSISVALYGLLMFYGLTKDELKGRRPLAKFLCIKLIVMFTFYQSFVFSVLEGRVIHATQYWTETNIADGLTALTICIEMVFFAAGMMWAYPSTPYKEPGVKTRIWRALWDSINYADFVTEIAGSVRFFIAYLRKEPNTHSPKAGTASDARKINFAQAFGVEGAGAPGAHSAASSSSAFSAGGGGGGGGAAMRNFAPAGELPRYVSGSGAPHGVDQYGEDVRLTTFSSRNAGSGSSSSVRASDDTGTDAAAGHHGAYKERY
ncbi:DUF300-domain-containing protein [Phellopilus nigrolimitatus]|nr:DUF300-domain-containing protein [Phellopilus nigrolimitatus]